MSTHKQMQCDGCAVVVSAGETIERVWTAIMLHVPAGMGRIEETFDLCPRCQDRVVNEILRTPARGRRRTE